MQAPRPRVARAEPATSKLHFTKIFFEMFNSPRRVLAPLSGAVQPTYPALSCRHEPDRPASGSVLRAVAQWSQPSCRVAASIKDRADCHVLQDALIPSVAQKATSPSQCRQRGSGCQQCQFRPRHREPPIEGNNLGLSPGGQRSKLSAARCRDARLDKLTD